MPDSGSDAANEGGSSGQLSALCSEYCTCMTTNCAGTQVGGGNCGQECMANGATWNLTCRINHCGYSPPAPDPPDTTHCGHAIGVGDCPDN